jgi:hypothetical protein
MDDMPADDELAEALTEAARTLRQRAEPQDADDLEDNGWIVDRTCYPWVAYRGPRFVPDEITPVITPQWPTPPKGLTEVPLERLIKILPHEMQRGDYLVNVGTVDEVSPVQDPVSHIVVGFVGAVPRTLNRNVEVYVIRGRAT